MARYGIVVDLHRCTGCMTCVLACKAEHLTGPGVSWNKVLEIDHESLDRVYYVRYACMHCDTPPCLDACPEHAIFKNQDGLVLIDQEKCKGHGECIKACPYGVIERNPLQGYFPGASLPSGQDPAAHRWHAPGKASKCTLCVHRIAEHKEPACVAGCPARAMTFGDLDDPESPIHRKLWQSKQLLAEKKTDAKVSYLMPQKLEETLKEKIREMPKKVIDQD